MGSRKIPLIFATRTLLCTLNQITMATKPNTTLKSATSRGNIVKYQGYDDSIFKTFKKDNAKRKKNKLARKARKIPRK